MVALLRVLSILHIAVCMPVRWLAGNTEHLAQYNFGAVSMGRTLDMLEDAFIKISSDGALLLDEDFVMNIFSEIVEEVEPVDKYLNFMFNEKSSNPVGTRDRDHKVQPYYCCVKSYSILLGKTYSKRMTLRVSWPVRRQLYSSWSSAIQQKQPVNTYQASAGPRAGATRQMRPSH